MSDEDGILMNEDEKRNPQRKKLKREILRPCSSKGSELRMSNKDGVLVNEEEKISTLDWIPMAPAKPKLKSGVIFILEKASLTLAFVGRRYQILNPDEHAAFLRKKNMNPANYRPDIVHEALCEIMDSRLRMAGRLKAVYIKTDEGILIKVKPNAFIPRDLGEFCNMMAELLQKLNIKARGKHEKLLHLVKNPVTNYLPANSLKIGLSVNSEKLVELRDYVNGFSDDEDLIFVVGAMAHGKIDCDYTDDFISVSSIPLSAAVCLSLIHVALENKWNIW